MTVNLHTHTYRCHHATGTERQYIQKAIENGITHMGFSDHSPFMEPNGHEQAHRVSVMDAPLYFQSLKTLRKEFEGQLRIYIGFEMEYYPQYFSQMLDVAISFGAEYLLLGQHNIRYGMPNQQASITPTEQEQDLSDYVDLVVEAMETGVFTYVAHPDLLNYVGSDEIYEKHMRRLCQAAVKNDLPLEINFLGIRDHRNYPNDRFWNIAGEEGCEVVFGCDAHRTKHAYDKESLEIAHKMVESFGLRYNPTPTIIHPITKERTNTNDSTKNT